MDTQMILYIIAGIGLLIVAIVRHVLEGKRRDRALAEQAGDAKKVTTSESDGMQQHLQQKKEFDVSYGKIWIYYGSQSGTATKFCNILSQEASANGFSANVEDLKEFKPEHITGQGRTLALFCMATQGEGEPTDNAVEFYKWLKDQEDGSNLCKDLRFSVFGLGNTQYEHYNLMGRQTNKHLERLGAKIVYKYGEGDDNSSLEDDFNEWKENIWTTLKAVVPQEKVEAGTAHTTATSACGFRFIETSSAETDLKNDGKKYEFLTSAYLSSSVAMVKKIVEKRQNNADGSTLHVEIDLKGTGMKYKTAMNLGVYAENDPSLVDKVATYLQADLNQRVDILVDEDKKEKFKLPFPTPISVRSILSKFCDFQGQIMKKTLKDLAKLTTNPEYTAKLEKLASAGGKKEFESEIAGQKKGLFDLLREYEIVPTLEQFVDLCPRLSPRLFTISSSDQCDAETVTITDSLLFDTLADGSVKHGICSKFVTNLNNKLKCGITNTRIRIDFRNSSFILPPSPQTPVIMIGPGTGVAPFIAFAQEKEALLEKGINIAPGEFTLYFGCRHEDGDFIFRDELREFSRKKIINKLYTAFSRDQSSKVYVQDLLLQNKDEFFKSFIEEKGVLYICGATAMGGSVIQAVVQILCLLRGVSQLEAREEVDALEKSKRIIKELW